MARLIDRLAHHIGQRLGAYLSRPHHVQGLFPATDPARLMACLQPADVVLVEGESRFSAAIKYLTQSTWSHAALFVGDAGARFDAAGRPCCFIEADLNDGVRLVSVAQYAGLHCRVCRPVGLTEAETRALIAFALQRLGDRYDLKNVIDLARYLLPTPPVPLHWRRRLLALGSGDPTRAICSTLIAEAFHAVHYPILPLAEPETGTDPLHPGRVHEVLRMRHHSLFVPRDFDVSPYFAIIKPTLAAGFDVHALAWRRDGQEALV